MVRDIVDTAALSGYGPLCVQYAIRLKKGMPTLPPTNPDMTFVTLVGLEARRQRGGRRMAQTDMVLLELCLELIMLIQ